MRQVHYMGYCCLIALFALGCNRGPAAPPQKQPSELNTSNVPVIDAPEIEPAPQVDFEFSPSLSVVEGTLHQVTFFGAPGFGIDPEHDEQETCFILTLNQPITVHDFDGGRTKTETQPPMEAVVDIQLVPGRLDVEKYKGLKMRMTGKFLRASTAHHFTDVIMELQEMKEL